MKQLKFLSIALVGLFALAVQSQSIEAKESEADSHLVMYANQDVTEAVTFQHPVALLEVMMQEAPVEIYHLVINQDNKMYLVKVSAEGVHNTVKRDAKVLSKSKFFLLPEYNYSESPLELSPGDQWKL